MTVTARVAFWRREKGWGVVESDQTPGGCWVHFSAVEIDGFRELHPGQDVDLDWEHARQDGYRFRAISVRPHRESPDQPPAAERRGPGRGPSAGFQSSLVIDWGQQPTPRADGVSRS